MISRIIVTSPLVCWFLLGSSLVGFMEMGRFHFWMFEWCWDWGWSVSALCAQTCTHREGNQTWHTHNLMAIFIQVRPRPRLCNGINLEFLYKLTSSHILSVFAVSVLLRRRKLLSTEHHPNLCLISFQICLVRSHPSTGKDCSYFIHGENIPENFQCNCLKSIQPKDVFGVTGLQFAWSSSYTELLKTVFMSLAQHLKMLIVAL